jgi:hypothetical protein
MTESMKLFGEVAMTRDEFILVAKEKTAKRPIWTHGRPAAVALARDLISAIPNLVSYAQKCSERYSFVMLVTSGQFSGLAEAFSLREESAGYMVYTFCQEFLVRPHLERLPDGSALMMVSTPHAYARIQELINAH